MIENDKLYLRAMEPEDAELLYQWENDYSMWEVGATTAPLSRYQLRQFIQFSRSEPLSEGQLRQILCLKSNDIAIGTADLYEIDTRNRRAAVGIFVEKQYRGQGYGSEMVGLLVDYSKYILGLSQLWATIPTDNQESLHAFESQGFSESGLLKNWLYRGNEWVDAVVVQKMLD